MSSLASHGASPAQAGATGSSPDTKKRANISRAGIPQGLDQEQGGLPAIDQLVEDLLLTNASLTSRGPEVWYAPDP